jgi:hypothetical protein
MQFTLQPENNVLYSFIYKQYDSSYLLKQILF